MPQSPSSIDADITIAGSGLSGVPLALALGGAAGETGLKILVLDQEDPDDAAAPEADGRGFALAASSRNLLEQLGVWPLIEADVQPMSVIDITDSKLEDLARPVLLHMNNETAPGEPAAYIIQSHVLRRALNQRLRDFHAIQVEAPARAVDFSADEALVTTTLSDGAERRSRVLVAADGRMSTLRQMAGIGTVDWPADQWGLVATIAHSKPHNSRGAQHFLPGGPFAILPLTNNRSSLVWTERGREAQVIREMSDDDFLFEIRRRIGDELGEITLEGGRNAFPLKMLAAREFVRNRFCLMGDAAHGMHWIAGQGLNYGLRDVAALAETLIDAQRLGLDIGSLAVLERYERWRRFDSASFTAGMAVLNNLFSTDNFLLRGIRDIGLGAVDHLPGLKRLLVKEAAGLSGDVPKLLRGEMI